MLRDTTTESAQTDRSNATTCSSSSLAKKLSTTLATAALCALKVFECFHSSGYGASYLEVGADNTSVLTGVGNTIANVGSLVAPVLGCASGMLTDAPIAVSAGRYPREVTWTLTCAGET